VNEDLKIAISFLSAGSYGGITYAEGLIPALAELDKTSQYHIFVLKDSPLLNLVQQENFFFHQCLSPRPTAWLKLLWEQLVLPHWLKKHTADVLFTAKNIAVLKAPCKVVISIRNMEPFCYSQYKNNWKLKLSSWLRKVLTRLSIRRADRVIAVSQFAKSHIERLNPGSNGRIDVIYNGNPVECRPEAGAAINDGAYLFSASKFVAYANQLNLIDAYASLVRNNKNIPPLWLAGGVHDKSYFKKVIAAIDRQDLTERVKILGLVSHQRMMQLYAGASAFIFPSTLEACPQTLIEAMSFGLPIAASNLPPMPEICADAAIYFDPGKPADMAEKIDSLLEDTKLRQNLRDKALAHSRFFTWHNTASELVRVFREVCENE